MQQHIIRQWLLDRGITESVIDLFGLEICDHPMIGEALRIPYTSTHSKYRRHPLDDKKPKYIYDVGGKVTLYGYQHIPQPLPVTAPILVTEGELDTLVGWSNNIYSVSSTGGAMSFQAEWASLPLFEYNPVYLCFDNDEAGADGMVRTLSFIPHARVVLVPETPGVKDISDYVARGGDLHRLLETALPAPTIENVEADRSRRLANWQSTRFHDRFLSAKRNSTERTETPNPYTGSDPVLKAKTYPMTSLIKFTKRKACCPWHSEKTPSLHYYPKTNSAYCFGGCGRAYDSIDAYRLQHHCSFTQAISDLNKMV